MSQRQDQKMKGEKERKWRQLTEHPSKNTDIGLQAIAYDQNVGIFQSTGLTSLDKTAESEVLLDDDI